MGGRLLIEPGARVLFQGDSITDAGRDRMDPFSLGVGYALIASAWFSAMHAGRDVSFLNRGVSGDRVKDLLARWDEDCVKLKPSWVSIMIGINDCWRRFDSGEETSAGNFEADYRKILAAAREKAGARLILLEPFVVQAFPEQKAWRRDLDPKIEAVRRLAKEFSAVLVHLDGIFAEACRVQPPAFWAADGVHPTPAGHALIARAWLTTAGAIS